MRVLLLVLLILGTGLVILLVNDGSGHSFGMKNDDFGRLVSLTPIALMLGAGLVLRRDSRIKALRQLFIWLAIIFALASAWMLRSDFAGIGNRLLAGFLPGQAVTVSGTDGTREVLIGKQSNGHFAAETRVNGVAVSMLVDTGASSVALTSQDARAAGINPDSLTYSTRIMTANGPAMAAPVTLKLISIGTIARSNIPAMVAEAGKLDQSLLGMSFLSTLSSMEMTGETLRLRN